MDEPEPTQDDMIKTHYLKHHPLWEFRNFDELHVDPYRYWLHGRADYYQTETYPGEDNTSLWDQGLKINHILLVSWYVFSFYWLGR